MKRIPLTRGKYAIVDDVDFVSLRQWKWHAIFINGKWYAARREYPSRRYIYMHRQILKAPKGLEADHRDENGLNNRRENIRLATHQQNNFNRGKRKTNSRGEKPRSKYKGISFDKARGKWSAELWLNGKKFFLGRFVKEIDAKKAYDVAAKKFHGQFIYSN